MKLKITSQPTYDLLVSRGHGVPRTDNNDIQDGWIVGKRYLVKPTNEREPLKVRCTQDCPYHLQVVHED